MPRPSRGELSGHGAGGRPPRAAGGLLRQHHWRTRRQERPAAALAAGPHQDCPLFEGEEVKLILGHIHVIQTGVEKVIF